MASFWCRWFHWNCPPKPFVSTPIAFTNHGVNIARAAGIELDGLKNLGVKFVRHTFYTKQDTGDYDGIFRARLLALDALGIETLIVVHDFDSAYEISSKMAELVKRYPNRLWQIGNEWDAATWVPFGNTGAQYAEIMREVIKVCPNTSFVGMGLATSDVPNTPPDIIRQPKFLTDYLNNSGPLLKAWCIHIYGHPVINTFKSLVTATQQVLKQRMPLWVTEYGTFDDDETERQMIVDITTNAPKYGVSRTYQYCFWAGDSNFGLVDRNDNPRPAFNELKNRIK